MSKATGGTQRDERLDFFRGLAMFIIFVAHVPGNGWNDWIPARFGFSSGSELFVFCSGAASAVAFGRLFDRSGMRLGSARVLLRIWQVYWAHVALFVVLAGVAAGADALLPGARHLETGFGIFVKDPGAGLLGVLTLTWLPPYLDILPMYLVLLAMIPAVMGLRRLSPAAPFVFCGGLYLLTWLLDLHLTGNPETGEPWFFNPFAWQLVFFAGFALMSGWVPTPRLCERRLMIAAMLFLVAAVPLSFWGFTDASETLRSLRDAILGPREKTDLHILRVVHFMVLVYVVLSLIEPWRARLALGPGRLIVMVGRQSLAVFLASLVFARLAWILFAQVGADVPTTALVNLAAFAGILAVAAVAGWFKTAPWQTRAPSGAPAPVAPSEHARVTRSAHA